MAAVLLDSRLPLVAAPMAGGPTTVTLARAVAAAGAFAFLAGGYKDPAALAAHITELRAALAADGSAPGFGVNLFVPQPPPPGSLGDRRLRRAPAHGRGRARGAPGPGAGP
ncbi:nitronate monooxygenase [Brachybacterium nesterenkovii]|uniref:nitronate monooxygenase n=1 Tax=Brachybacterium nesterenkovii TaxID=47847 RepID=UPI00321AA6DD